MIQELNLPKAELRLKKEGGLVKILCLIRNQFLVCTPEEWVRQHYLSYLINDKNYPKGQIASEYALAYNGLKKRADIVVFNKEGNPIVIVECKAPKIKISEDTFFQIAQYQSQLRVPFLVMTNGLNHFNCFVSIEENPLKYIPEIPDYQTLITSIPA